MPVVRKRNLNKLPSRTFCKIGQRASVDCKFFLGQIFNYVITRLQHFRDLLDVILGPH